MLNQLEHVNEARKCAQRIVFKGAEQGEPMWSSRAVVIWFLREAAKLPVPSDVLAFASGGQVSDKDVVDWEAPDGGLKLLRV